MSQFSEPLADRLSLTELQACGGQRGAQARELCGRQSVFCRRARGRIEHLREVHSGVACHRKGQLRLPRASALDAYHHKRAGVQDRGQRRKPRLVDVLRAKEAESGVGEVALEQLRRPALPVAQQHGQRLKSMRMTVTPQQLARRRRRTGARIQQRNAHFAPGERLVENRQVPDHDREKAKAHAAFNHREQPRHRRARQHVPQPQREKRRAAQVKIRGKVCCAVGGDHRRAHGPVQQREADDQPCRPHAQQKKQRKGTKKAEEGLTALCARQHTRQRAPRSPRRAIEQPRQPELSSDAAGQNNGFEGVPKDNQQQSDAQNRDEDSHSGSPLDGAAILPGLYPEFPISTSPLHKTIGQPPSGVNLGSPWPRLGIAPRAGPDPAGAE